MLQPDLDVIVDSVYDFLKGRNLQYSEEDIKNAVRKHLHFGTCDILFHRGKISAVCRWNITQDGLVCDVLDLFIAKGEPGLSIIRYLVARNWGKFMSVKYIRFARSSKYPKRSWRVYRIEDILKLRRLSYGR